MINKPTMFTWVMGTDLLYAQSVMATLVCSLLLIPMKDAELMHMQHYLLFQLDQ